jgi:hypothetical protein
MTAVCLALGHEGFAHQNCAESYPARAGSRPVSNAEDASETYTNAAAKFERLFESDPDAGSADSAQLRGS